MKFKKRLLSFINTNFKNLPSDMENNVHNLKNSLIQIEQRFFFAVYNNNNIYYTQ